MAWSGTPVGPAAAGTADKADKPGDPPITCASGYTTQSGDTLTKIARRAYGEPNYPAIYLANRDVLPNLKSLFVGVRLWIPCLDGTGPRSRAEAKAQGLLDTTAAEASQPAASAASVVADAPGITLLSGPDFAPFADPRLPDGGMIAELVKLSLARAAPGRPVHLDFVNDWSRHLTMLKNGKFNVGFPWYKPDCDHADRLSGTMKARCSGFVFSKPLFEVAMAFYVRAGDPLASAQTPDSLYGTRLCRPADYFTFDLEQAALVPPKVTRVIPPTTADCFRLLEQNAVDVVSVSTTAAAAALARQGLQERVTTIPALASTQTLHVVAAADSAEGRADIALIDQGLEQIERSGRWFEVVSRHLGAYGLALQ